MLLAKFVGETLFSRVVVEGANIHLVAARAVAFDPFVFLWVVEPLYCGVTLAALDALLAVVPAYTILEGLAVLRGILKEVGRPSEVAGVMRIDAALRVVAVLLCWAPTRLVEEHEEDIPLLLRVNVSQGLVEVVELEQALRHEVVFDTLVLKVSVHSFDELQVCKSEAHQLVRCLVLVKSHYKRPIEPIVTEKLQLLCVVISRKCLLRALHVKNVKEKVGVLVLLLVVKRSAIDAEVWRCLRVQMLLEH